MVEKHEKFGTVTSGHMLKLLVVGVVLVQLTKSGTTHKLAVHQSSVQWVCFVQPINVMGRCLLLVAARL
ncbi:hypothetical protein ACOMHN_053279 [Nucella lapillus]